MNRLIILLIGLWINAPASADGGARNLFEPFVTSNLNPFTQIHHLPANRSATPVGDAALQWHVTTEFANHFTSSSAGNESIDLDGETWRTSISLRYGLKDRWEVGLGVPIVKHHSGSLDNFIENWHQVFGLPNSGREDVAQDQLLFSRTVDGVRRTHITSQESGVGDITLDVSYLVNQSEHSAWMLSGGVKLPTGDANKLTGSESTNLFFASYYSRENFLGKPALSFHGRAGAMWLGNSDLPETKDWMVFGSSTLAWKPWQRVSLKTQIDLNSAVYESRLRELGDPSVQLTLGGAIQLTDQTVLELGVVEDIVTDTAPDVVLHFGLHHRF